MIAWLRNTEIPVRYLRWLHAALTIVWFVLVIPSVVWWRNSVPWLVFMSVWANVAGHFGSWQSARAESVAGDGE